MKKIYLLGTVVVLCLVMATGCKDKTVKLNCVKAEKENGMDTNSKFSVTFKNDTIKLIKSYDEITVIDTYKENLDILYSALQQKYEDSKKDKGVIVKTTKTEDSVALEITVNAIESPEQVEIVGYSIKNDMNYNEVKEVLEAYNFVCTEE